MQAGCDINQPDRWGFHPVHYAAEMGHIGCLRRLSKHSVDMNALTSGTSTASSHPTLSSGVNGKLGTGSIIGLSPLMLAARNGRVEALRFLLKNGADVSLTNSNGETVLHHAAECSINPKECLTVLLAECTNLSKQKSLLNAQVCGQLLSFTLTNPPPCSASYEFVESVDALFLILLMLFNMSI